MAEIAAGQAVIELLRAEGVEYVFGVTIPVYPCLTC